MMAARNPGEVARAISRTPFVLSDEKSVQVAISALLDSMGVRHRREVMLSPGNVVDFMLEGGTAIEVKIRAQRRAVYRQCERYCRHPQVNALVLATATATGFPGEIEGKPCWVASLGSGWL